MSTTSVQRDHVSSQLAALTDAIIAGIEDGASDWKMPWVSWGDSLSPTNVQTRNTYTGGNRLWLAIVAGQLPGPNVWGTYKQWRSQGGQVRKGEHALASVLRPMDHHRAITNDDGSEEERRWITWAAYPVFHASQVDGWVAPETKGVNGDPIDAAEALVSRWRDAGMVVRHGGGAAYYEPAADVITLPERAAFEHLDFYYTTHFHEATHWTGPRTGRDQSNLRFGDDRYAAEELVAELGAAFLAADTGVEQAPRPDHAAYLAAWLRVLRSDPKHLWTIAAKAETAATYLLKLGGEL